MLHVPFPRASLVNPVSIRYGETNYKIIIGSEEIGEYLYCVSIKKDIENIEEAIDQYVEKNPHELCFYANTTEDSSSVISIPHSENILATHITNWAYHWGFKADDFEQLNEIISVYGHDKHTYGFSSGVSSQNIFDTVYVGTPDNIITTTGTSTVTNSNLRYVNNHYYSLSVTLNKDTHLIFPFFDGNGGETKLDISLPNLNHKFLILATLIKVNDKLEYLFKDMLNMSKPIYKYFINYINDFIDTNMTSKLSTSMRIAMMSKSDPDMYDILYKVTDLIHRVITNIPKYINEYPFDNPFYIPNISAKPESDFQWAITNILARKDTGPKRLESTKYLSDIKGNTKKLLEGIHADDKALLMFLKYRGVIDSEGQYSPIGMNYPKEKREFIYGMSQGDLFSECKKLLEFIKDGDDIQKRYPMRIEIPDYGSVKMSPIKGTILKQTRNAIFNHRIEEKLSLETRLKLLREAAPDDDLMYCEVKFQDELESTRIKYKSEMIILGKQLKHCIGNSTNSNNYFFNKGNVCAEVNSETLKVKQCYDIKNTTTEESEEFKSWLEDQFIMWWASHNTIVTDEINEDQFEENIQILRGLFEKHGPKHTWRSNNVYGVANDNNEVDGEVRVLSFDNNDGFQLDTEANRVINNVRVINNLQCIINDIGPDEYQSIIANI